MAMRKVEIEPSIELLEDILAPWHAHLGANFQGYRNHCYRVLHLCYFQIDATADQRHKLIIASAFHQLGAFAHQTLDHLSASQHLAEQYLQQEDLGDWCAELSDILAHHQKLSKIKPKTKRRQAEEAGETDGHDWELVEVFRQAYVADLSMGLIKGYLPGPFLASVNDSFASAGYYSHLAKGHVRWLRHHPTRPMPLLKW